MSEDINELGKKKPPFHRYKGQSMHVWRGPSSKRTKHLVTFLQWVRNNGWVTDSEPWHAKIINENGRIEVVRASQVTK